MALEPKSFEVMRQRTIDNVKKQLNVAIGPMLRRGIKPDAQKLSAAIVRTLAAMKNAQVIQAFNVDAPEVERAKPFYDVADLPPDAQPGDMYSVKRGDDCSEYRGIVVSVDGEGKGMVFGTGYTGDGSEVVIRCRVQPTAMIDYVVLEFKITT